MNVANPTGNSNSTLQFHIPSRYPRQNNAHLKDLITLFTSSVVTYRCQHISYLKCKHSNLSSFSFNNVYINKETILYMFLYYWPQSVKADDRYKLFCYEILCVKSTHQRLSITVTWKYMLNITDKHRSVH